MYGPDEDLFPLDEEGQKRIIEWVRRRYEDAKSAKKGHQKRWDKFYKMYRSYVKERKDGDWRSRIWIPIAFFVIETVTPRLVAQLPAFTVEPVGPEDSPAAELMETLLTWASDQSGLYLELVSALKSALMYGTGILKTSYEEKVRYDIRREPEMEEQYAEIPMMDPSTGQPMMDLDGNPMTQEVSIGAQPTGELSMVRTPYVAYSGPKAEAVDIDNFFIDPVASTVENARYVIHRVYRDRSHLQEMFEKGVYKRPPEDLWNAFLTEHAALRRQDMIGYSTSSGLSAGGDKTMIELLEVWTDKTVVTVAGAGERGGFILLRVIRNPYAHGEKPFVRIVDHLVPHEFWGIGELEPLEGLQDIMNALWNSRIDNVKLVLNTMFLAVMDYIVDPADLQVRPAGVVRVTEGVPLDQAVKPLNLGEVTGSSYEELSEAERMTEKVSGVSQLTAGTGADPSVGRTATGLTLVSETGNARFSHKVRIAELTGFRSLARQFASCLQQYTPEEMVVRIDAQAAIPPQLVVGAAPDGRSKWASITPDSIGGRFDFDVEGESSSQTESMRREQTLSLFQMLAADPYSKPLKIREDVLKVFGRKNIQDYLLTPEELQQLYAAQAAQGQEEADAEGSVQ